MDRILQNCSGAVGIADDIATYGATEEEYDRNLSELVKTTLCGGLVSKFKQMLHQQDQHHRFRKCLWQTMNMAWPTQGSRSESYSKTWEQGWTSTFHRLHDICHTSSRVSLWNLPLSETFSKRIWIPMGAVPSNYIWSSEEVLEPSLLHDYLSEGPVYLQCDTSLRGLRAALLQVHGNQSRPVTYASQTQMDTEQCYACIECVIFAIVFSIKHFHTYLCRHSFNVLTDHKPLLIIIDKPIICCPTPRLQWMLMRLLQGFNLIRSIIFSQSIQRLLRRFWEMNVIDAFGALSLLTGRWMPLPSASFLLLLI